MRQKILDLIKNHPKHYTVMIKKDLVLLDWVNQKTLVQTDHLPERIYSAVHQETNICPEGNKKHVSRFNGGWKFCGHSNSCICSKKSTAISVSKTKMSASKEEKDRIQTAREKTMIEKYGVAFNGQRESCKEKLRAPKIPIDAWNKLNDKDWLIDHYVTQGKNLVTIAAELEVYYSTIAFYCNKFEIPIRRYANHSKMEIDLRKFLESKNIEYVPGDWTVLGNLELDIYIPDHDMAIEVNGLYWHSYDDSEVKKENKFRHIEKTISSNVKGVNLLHFTDRECLVKNDVVKSIISKKLGILPKLNDFVIGEINNLFAVEFNNAHGIGESISGDSFYGMYHDSDLVSVAYIDNKVLKYVEHKDYDVVSGLVSIAEYLGDILIETDSGKVFDQEMIELGFTKISDIEPAITWTDGTNIHLTEYSNGIKNRRYWGNGSKLWKK